MTEWGRYRYLTAPQGYIASGDGYTRRYDQIVAGIKDHTKCIDDALLWSDDTEAAFHQATQWLDICGHNGITLNPSKFSFARDEVDFAGYTISTDEVRPKAEFTDAIMKFPVPKSITDIRAWFGLVNQVSYTFSMTQPMLPFRSLLEHGAKFSWTPQHQEAMDESKIHICKQMIKGVAIYDMSLPIPRYGLVTNWDRVLAAAKALLMLDAGPRMLQRRMEDVAHRLTIYSQGRIQIRPYRRGSIGGVYALSKTRHFVLGCPDLTIIVDHKPLVAIFGDRSLEQIDNIRLRGLKEKTLQYSFKIQHIQGIKNIVPDALSRYPSVPFPSTML